MINMAQGPPTSSWTQTVTGFDSCGIVTRWIRNSGQGRE